MAKRRTRKSGMLTLSAPKEVTWIVAVVAGGLGILAHLGVLNIGVSAVVLLMVGFVVLAIATAVRGL
jgi:hypothetical protein